MVAFYVGLQVAAVALMAVNCWIPALLVAGVALTLCFRRPVARWLKGERSARGGRRVPPRPAQVR